jgi:hypothetical protein
VKGVGAQVYDGNVLGGHFDEESGAKVRKHRALARFF